MGSFAKLTKTFEQAKKTKTNNVVETEKDKEFSRYLESLTDSELNELYQNKLAEMQKQPYWIQESKRIALLSEAEIWAEIQEKLKMR